MSSAALLVTGRVGKAATRFWARSGELARVSVNTCSHKMAPLRPIVLDALEFVPNPRLLTEADAAAPSLCGRACQRFDALARLASLATWEVSSSASRSSRAAIRAMWVCARHWRFPARRDGLTVLAGDSYTTVGCTLECGTHRRGGGFRRPVQRSWSVSFGMRQSEDPPI